MEAVPRAPAAGAAGRALAEVLDAVASSRMQPAERLELARLAVRCALRVGVRRRHTVLAVEHFDIASDDESESEELERSLVGVGLAASDEADRAGGRQTSKEFANDAKDAVGAVDGMDRVEGVAMAVAAGCGMGWWRLRKWGSQQHNVPA